MEDQIKSYFCLNEVQIIFYLESGPTHKNEKLHIALLYTL